MSKKPPKRPAEDFIRRQLDGDMASGSKKPRFDARNPSTLAAEAPDETDAILELDEIGRGGAQTKRNAVRLEGYESDSSTENFDARAQARADDAELDALGKNKGQDSDDDDDDMFGGARDTTTGDGELEGKGKKRKKEVKFMDQSNIEGQVQSSRSGGHVSANFSLSHKARDQDDESSSDSGDDEERDRVDDDVDQEIGAGGKKRHAPKLDAFNMRNEAEEGRFDESGNFVRNAADPMAVHDRWLEGSSKAEMKRAKQAHEKREEERRQRDQADDAVSASDALAALISRLQNGETVLEALARLGSSKAKKKPNWQKKKLKGKRGEMDIDEAQEATDAQDDAAETQRKETVEALTTAADQLLSRDQPEIYDTERGLLMRLYKRETGEDWMDSEADRTQLNGDEAAVGKQWQYRWSDARDGGEVHGPYDGATMKSWNEAGYFGEGVEFRQMGTSGWERTVEFT